MDSTVDHRTLKQGAMLNWYRVERILGRGGFGVIYLATDTNLDHQVAIKEYIPSDIAQRASDSTVQPITVEHGDMYRWGLDRFIKEARNLVRFKHPNIVRVISVFQENNTAYMVMEFERGEELRPYFRHEERRTEEHLKGLILPISEGLAEVHRHGFIHRDIKPSNILVRTDGSPVLLDFGSARNASQVTSRGLTALVSAGYAPMEQYGHNSEEQQGPWTDVYALGGVLYFAISGQDPVDSMQRSVATFNNSPDMLVPAVQVGAGHYSESFLRAIDWALQLRIADRPSALDDWMSALMLTESPVDASQTTRELLERQTGVRPPVLDGATRVSQRETTGPTSTPSEARPSRRATDQMAPNDRQRSQRAGPALAEELAPTRMARPVPARADGAGRWRWLGVAMLGTAAVGVGVWSAIPTAEPDKSAPSDGASDTNSGPTPEETQLAERLEAERMRQREQAAADDAAAERAAALEAEQRATAEAELEAQQLAAEQAAEAAAARKTEQLAAEKAAEQAKAREAERLAAEKAAAREAERLAAESAAQEAAAREAERVAAEQAAAEAAAQEAERQQAAEQAAAQEAAEKRQIEARAALDGALVAATAALRRGDLVVATEQLALARTTGIADTRIGQLAERVQSAQDERNRPVSDADFDHVVQLFDKLSKAIEASDEQAVDSLAEQSDQTRLFARLFETYKGLKVDITGIQVRNAEKAIYATLRIEQMIRDNGDLGTPSDAWRDRTISSHRRNGEWSKIEW